MIIAWSFVVNVLFCERTCSCFIQKHMRNKDVGDSCLLILPMFDLLEDLNHWKDTNCIITSLQTNSDFTVD